ncbi:MAG: N-acetylmuramoyl-L-alanine amidase [Clostridiales bacterium]|nr:N-acetylmuramoyl-L-alanine amidase [Clostridiales bacterium]
MKLKVARLFTLSLLVLLCSTVVLPVTLAYPAVEPKPVVPQQSATPFPSPVPVPTSTPLPLSGKVVFLDPGHGRDANGKYKWGGCITEDGALVYVEADIVLSFALRAKQKLEAQGATVYLTREDSYMAGNYRRMAQLHIFALENTFPLDGELRALLTDMQAIYDGFASGENKSSSGLEKIYFNTPYRKTRNIRPATKALFDLEAAFADRVLFISLHTNASAAVHSGTMVYYVDNKTNTKYYTNYQEARNKKLAEALFKYIPQEISLPAQGIARNDYFMLREHNFPAALVEVGYHSNPTDRAILTDPATPDKLARGIYLAVCAYFEVAP